MLPHVILHAGVSLDGRMDWGVSDEGLYYELAARWKIDAMLSGSGTLLTAYASQDEWPASPASAEPRELHPFHIPLLVVVDSRGQIHKWNRIRQEPYWKDVLVLVSQATPKTYLDELEQKHVNYLVAGQERVDLRMALEELGARCGVKLVRVDSGGTLNGVLLRAGLVSEVSVLISPGLVGGTSPRSLYVAPDLTSAEGVVKLKLECVEKMRGDVVWLKYEVAR